MTHLVAGPHTNVIAPTLSLASPCGYVRHQGSGQALNQYVKVGVGLFCCSTLFILNCVCNAANMCPDLDDPANGAVDQRGSGFGNTALYSCDPGYIRVGPVVRTCLANGQWSSNAAVCNRKGS